MKILLIILLFSSPIVFSQSDTVKNSVINFDDSYGCFPQLDKLPMLVDGIDSLQSKLIYPLEAIKNKIQGTIYVKVTIDTSGKPMDAEILKSLGFGCDEEVLRLVNNAKYTPAYFLQKPTKVAIVIPIKFKHYKNIEK